MDNIYVTTNQSFIISYNKSIHIRNFDYNCEHSEAAVYLSTILNDLIIHILLQTKYDV